MHLHHLQLANHKWSAKFARKFAHRCSFSEEVAFKTFSFPQNQVFFFVFQLTQTHGYVPKHCNRKGQGKGAGEGCPPRISSPPKGFFAPSKMLVLRGFFGWYVNVVVNFGQLSNENSYCLRAAIAIIPEYADFLWANVIVSPSFEKTQNELDFGIVSFVMICHAMILES